MKNTIKNTIKNAAESIEYLVLVALIAFCIGMVGGCDGSTSGLDDAGVATSTGTTTNTLPTTSTTTVTGTTTTTTTTTATQTNTAVAVCGGSTINTGVTGVTTSATCVYGQTKNPCETGNFAGLGIQCRDSAGVWHCGWDTKTGACWPTVWCEPSESTNSPASVNGLGLGDSLNPLSTAGNPYPIAARPQSVSKACSVPGTVSATVKAGSMMVWGYEAINASMTSNASGYYLGSNLDGYVCVPNAHDLTIGC